MSVKDDGIYLAHILECIADVQSYAREGRTSLEDKKTYDAVLRKLQIMAESTQRLSANTKQAIPEIDWNQISGFRCVLVHDYLGDLNADKIWQVIEHRLPELKAALQRYQEEHS